MTGAARRAARSRHHLSTEGTMKAAVVHDFTRPLSIENVPRPEPSDGQVLVRIEAADRDLAADPVEHLLRHRLEHLGGDEAGRDRVDREPRPSSSSLPSCC
jgi:hypothetical protein